MLVSVSGFIACGQGFLLHWPSLVSWPLVPWRPVRISLWCTLLSLSLSPGFGLWHFLWPLFACSAPCPAVSSSVSSLRLSPCHRHTVSLSVVLPSDLSFRGPSFLTCPATSSASYSSAQFVRVTRSPFFFVPSVVPSRIPSSASGCPMASSASSSPVCVFSPSFFWTCDLPFRVLASFCPASFATSSALQLLHALFCMPVCPLSSCPVASPFALLRLCVLALRLLRLLFFHAPRSMCPFARLLSFLALPRAWPRFFVVFVVPFGFFCSFWFYALRSGCPFALRGNLPFFLF